MLLRRRGIDVLVRTSGADPDCVKPTTKGQRERLIAFSVSVSRAARSEQE